MRRPTTTTTPSPPTPERRKRRRSGDVSPINEVPERERAATTTTGTLQPAAEEWIFPEYDVESETEWLEAFRRLTAPPAMVDTTTTTTTPTPAPAEPDSSVVRREVSFLEDLGELEDSRQRSRSRTPRVGREVERRRSTRIHTTSTSPISRKTTTASTGSAATTTPQERSRRRDRAAATPRREEVDEDYPEEHEAEESGDIFPSHVNLAGNVPEYVRESEDFRLISRWVSRLPQSGRSYYEGALRTAIQPASISGGRVGICFGDGDVDVGPLGRESDGSSRDWDEDLPQLEERARRTTNWSNLRLSDLLPVGFRRCFATHSQREGRWIASTIRSPRSFWRVRPLPRTSLARCVACLAQELASREETAVTATHYKDCLRDEETERWRRMRPSTRVLVFRQHSCMFGAVRESRWHGLITSTQIDLFGGELGWITDIRVYVTASIPAGHPEMYRRGTMRVDVVFTLPRPFEVLLGREVRMRGQLNWEGSRASRGQAMSLMWVPFPSDGEGLSGPVRLRRWVFESDF